MLGLLVNSFFYQGFFLFPCGKQSISNFWSKGDLSNSFGGRKGTILKLKNF